MGFVPGGYGGGGGARPYGEGGGGGYSVGGGSNYGPKSDGGSGGGWSYINALLGLGDNQSLLTGSNRNRFVEVWFTELDAPVSVPEPASLTLLGAGVIAIVGMERRRRA